MGGGGQKGEVGKTQYRRDGMGEGKEGGKREARTQAQVAA